MYSFDTLFYEGIFLIIEIFIIKFNMYSSINGLFVEPQI